MRNRKSQLGFTLVEVLVSSLVFSILVLAVSSLFVQILDNEQRSFAAQEIQENGLFVLESMAREIRVSQIQNQDSPDCSATSLTIVHPIDGIVTYSLSGDTLQRTASNSTTNITASTIKFSRFNFCVTGSNAGSKNQARVAILASIQNTTGKQTLTFNLQTTVTSRDVFIKFTQ